MNERHFELIRTLESNWLSTQAIVSCTCKFPMVVYRNGSGHHDDCQVQKDWLRTFKEKDELKKIKKNMLSEPYCVYCGTSKETGRTNCKNCGAPYRRV